MERDRIYNSLFQNRKAIQKIKKVHPVGCTFLFLVGDSHAAIQKNYS